MPILQVVAGIIWRKEQYLAVERPQGKIQAGWWEFPGGKIEKGEDAATALVRELAEELGIKAEAPQYWQSLDFDYGHRQVCLHFFHVRTFTGEAQPLEGQKLRWLSPHEALSLPFLEADLPVVQALHAAKNFE